MSRQVRRSTSLSGWQHRLVAAAVVVALVLVGCGSDDDESTTTSSDSDEPSAATTAEDSTSTSTDESTTSGSTATSASTSTTVSTTLPGSPFEGFASEGDVLAVIGVAHDDVLNIRSLPGTDQDIVITASPTADDLVATGRGRRLIRTIWYEVTADGQMGWANSSFLVFLGATDDATAEFLDGGPPIEAETMVDLGTEVATGFASTDPASSIVQSVAPSVGDLGEVTYDVVGIGDDSIVGYRLHIFATPNEGGEGFVLKSIERTWLCGRGTSGELCV